MLVMIQPEIGPPSMPDSGIPDMKKGRRLAAAIVRGNHVLM